MNVFVLCTGRSGSQTFLKACAHIQNFTSGHETRSKFLGNERLNYPVNHIEGDNRLSWFLGQLDEKYGKDAYYIHLIRNRSDVARSFNNRWLVTYSIIKGYAHAIKLRKIRKLSLEEKFALCEDYYDTVNANIRFFLKDKPAKQTIYLENIKDGFQEMCERTGAEVDLEKAFEVLSNTHNASKKMNPFKRFFKKLI